MRLSKLAIAGAAFVCSVSAQAADLNDAISIRSFGTVGLVHSDSDEAVFTTATGIVPDGAGGDDRTHYANDTKFATQIEWTINDRFSSTVQLVSKQYENKQWAPRVEWAFVKFKATDTLALRAGRVRPPIYMLSDYLDVNYANAWVRPPVEHYFTIPVTNMDGVDLLWQPAIGNTTFLVQPYYGEKDLKLKNGGASVRTENAGLSVSASNGNFSYRFGYLDMDVLLDLQSMYDLEATLGGICAMGELHACQGLDQLHLDDTSYRFISVGGTWDNGDYFVTGEYGTSDTNSITLADATSWYMSAGKRFDRFTPYVTFAEFSNDSPATYTASPFPITNMILTGVRGGGSHDQNTLSLGVRYDVLANISLKLQWDHIQTKCKNGIPGTCEGMFEEPTTEFQNSANDVNLFSISADFTF